MAKMLIIFHLDGQLLREVGRNKLKRIFLPDSMLEYVIKYYNTLYGQHGAVTKTYREIAKRFYYNLLYKTVVEFVKNCIICQQFKPYNKNTNVHTKSTVPTGIWDKFYIDFIGP